MSRDRDTAAILASLDNWKGHVDDREAGRYVNLLVQGIEWEGMKHDALRRVLVAIASAVDDKTLRDLACVADDDRQTFFECTIGNDIGEALQRCGLGPAQAEKIAHGAIRQALDQAAEQEATVQP